MNQKKSTAMGNTLSAQRAQRTPRTVHVTECNDCSTYDPKCLYSNEINTNAMMYGAPIHKTWYGRRVPSNIICSCKSRPQPRELGAAEAIRVLVPELTFPDEVLTNISTCTHLSVIPGDLRSIIAKYAGTASRAFPHIGRWPSVFIANYTSGISYRPSVFDALVGRETDRVEPCTVPNLPRLRELLGIEISDNAPCAFVATGEYIIIYGLAAKMIVVGASGHYFADRPQHGEIVGAYGGNIYHRDYNYCETTFSAATGKTYETPYIDHPLYTLPCGLTVHQLYADWVRLRNPVTGMWCDVQARGALNDYGEVQENPLYDGMFVGGQMLRPLGR